MKNKILAAFLVALLFVTNPVLVFAEELIPVEEPVVEVEEEFESELDLVETEEDIEAGEELFEEEKIEPETEENNEEENFSEEEIELFNLNTFDFEETETLEIFETLEATETPATITVNVSLRYNDAIIFNGPVDLFSGSTTILTDNTNTDREIFSDTVLAALNQTDILSDDFTLSDLIYYESFDSFLINCIDVELPDTDSVNACYNWQYVVNDTYPFVGVDQYNLEDGDEIYFYFGIPRVVELSTTTIFVGDSVTATAKTYDYKNNIYVPLVDHVVGLTQVDPSNPWSPTVLSATSSDDAGQATFQIDTAGLYGIGLESDYYYPVYDVLVVENSSETTATSTATSTVISATTTATTTADTSGGSNNSSDAEIDIEKAINFLISQQKSSGSFGADLYTDWAALALFATKETQSQNLVKNYLKSDKISGSIITDFERRTMALMSAGINPYTGTGVNYISEILKTFDGNQFGDSDLINDDIFAIFPLLNSGYDSDDEEIKKAASFLISKQNSNGSWESIDLTAAAIQALVLVKDLPQVNQAISKARTYLKSQQKSDGGFGDTFATLWTMQAISALGEKTNSWTSGNENPLTYIASKQADDGGLNEELDLNSRIWATSYLIPAYYEKTWSELMKSFSKQETEAVAPLDGGSGNSSDDIVADTAVDEFTATSTLNSELENINEQDINIEIPIEQFVAEIENVINGEISVNELAERLIEDSSVNLEANALDSVNNQNVVNIITVAIQNIIQHILAGTTTMLAAVFSLFNF